MQFYNGITGETVSSQPWQEKLKPGDCYVIDNPAIGLLLEGQVMPIPDIQIYGQVLNANGCDAGFFNVRAYSAICPEGETGMICVMEPTRIISPAEFEDARRNGWVA